MLIPEERWTAIRRRARLPAFTAVIQRLQAESAGFEARPVAIPGEPGGYYHDYFCPEHGLQLTFDPAAPTEHRCPFDGARYRGERYDAA
jgi:hypothetical protein